MQENNFEKQVQQKTGELKLTPSEEVWQKVAAAITKRKNDRRVFAFFFLLLLFMGASFFIIRDHSSGRKINNTISKNNNPGKTQPVIEYINDSNTRQIADAPNSEKTGNKNPGDQTPVIKDIPLMKKTGSRQKITLVHLPKKRTISVAANGPVNNNIAGLKETKAVVHPGTKKISFETKQKPGVLVRNGDTEDLANETTGSGDTGKIKVVAITPLINDVAVNERIADSVSANRTGIKKQAKDTIAGMQKADLQKTVPEKSVLQTKQKNKWKIGFTLSAGLAATQNGYLGIIGQGSNDENKAYNAPSQSTGGTNGGQGAYPTYVPSKVKAGTGLILGVFVQKSISAKTSILLGLNYKSCSSRMMIGNRVDSSSNINLDNSFYRSGNVKKYKNHFHFIELPVTLRFKLGKQNKFPVYLNTGVSISRLVSSNSLQFDTSTGYYYRNNALFNKTQVNVSAGLLFSLSQHAKAPFLIGPDINFSINKMAKSGLYKGRRYSYFGILVQKNIGKK
jgi:Outer membrane protein beta-barrel domain